MVTRIKNIVRFSGFLIAIFFILPYAMNPARADLVIMKNGKQIKGRILKEEFDTVTIMTPSISFVLQMKDIEKIERDPNLSPEEALGDVALEDKQYYEALRYYQEALKNDPGKESVLEKIENIRKIQEEEVKRRFGQQLGQVDRFIEEKQFDKGEELLQQILSNLPDESLADPVKEKLSFLYYSKALEYLNTVDDIKAEESLKKAIDAFGSSYESHLLYADLLSRNPRSYDSAIQHYLKGLEIGARRLAPEKLSKYLRSLALLYEYKKQYENAITYHKMILEKDPVNYPDTRNRIVNAYLYLYASVPETDFAKRREYLQAAIEIDPYSINAHLALASLYYNNNLIEECLFQCRKISEIDSKLPDLNYYQALCLLQKKELEKAREALERELSNNPGNYEALSTLGDYYLNGGQYEKAIESYEKATQLRQEKYHAYIGLARAYRKLEKHEKAKEYLEQVFVINPDHIEAILLSGALHKDAQDYKKALELFNNVIDRLTQKDIVLNPESRRLLVEALIQRGELNIIMDSPRIAIVDFQESLKYQPDYAEIYYHIAQTNIKLGKYPEAEEFFFKAQSLEPKNPKYYLGLGIMYHNNLKQTRKAIDNYRKYIELGGEDFAKVNEWIKECGGEPVVRKVD
ncbi:tetratricopeptide repeat protein [Candidatus Sumerlaeota bacterium]|nr:tetratricopeptide repeat protein [Candidatus Sumerlaeota bacterium]